MQNIFVIRDLLRTPSKSCCLHKNLHDRCLRECPQYVSLMVYRSHIAKILMFCQISFSCYQPQVVLWKIVKIFCPILHQQDMLTEAINQAQILLTALGLIQ